MGIAQHLLAFALELDALEDMILFAMGLSWHRQQQSLILWGAWLLALMLTSAIWSAIPVLADETASLPVAGPSGQSGGGLGAGGSSSVDTALIKYLEAHKGSAKYLVAVVSSNEADAIILATNEPIMALGGFSAATPS